MDNVDSEYRALLIHFLIASLTYLLYQEILNYFLYISSLKNPMMTFHHSEWYFAAPLISMVLIVATFFILIRLALQNHAYWVYILAWLILLIPQMIPPLFMGLNIIYVTWVIVLTATVIGTIAYKDLILRQVSGSESLDLKKFDYSQLRFYIDKLATSWLALGAVLAVCMTILWTAPENSFQMDYSERVFWAVYMVLCFVGVSLLVVYFVAYPTISKMRLLRKEMEQ